MRRHGTSAEPERARWPRFSRSPHPLLRSLMPRGYTGFTEATTPRHLMLPATTFVPLVVKLLDEALLRRLERGPRPSPEVARAWQRLVTTAGAAPIGRIAAEVGWSHKHLITRFRQQIGLSPKTAARLVRFERVWCRLDARRSLDWGQVAAEAGYADQAHLIRDFRQFTGTTPADFLARMRAPIRAPKGR
jgi:AraC-like DNA-binding protein